MARVYRTAQGKMLDMASLAAKNETIRAVSNVKVNARGDTIDGTGKVIVPATQKVGDMYSKTVGNKSANVVNKKAKPAPADKKELTPEELDLESSFNDDIEVENIKAEENKKKKR